jgi:hypothetical protein
MNERLRNIVFTGFNKYVIARSEYRRGPLGLGFPEGQWLYFIAPDRQPASYRFRQRLHLLSRSRYW